MPFRDTVVDVQRKLSAVLQHSAVLQRSAVLQLSTVIEFQGVPQPKAGHVSRIQHSRTAMPFLERITSTLSVRDVRDPQRGGLS